MEVHQLLASTAEGDAITNAALDLQQQLRQRGHSEIFARHVDPRLADRIRPLEHYDGQVVRSGADLIVYRVSIGEPDVFAFLQRRPEPLAIIYHNISPSSYWAPYDARFAALLDSGREELAQLAGRVELAIADSEFNAAELRSLGYPKVVVNPIVVDPSALRTVPSDPTMANFLDCLDGPKYLFVGQMLPHKRPDWLLRAYHILATYLEPQAHLLLVGADRLQPYRRALNSFVAELSLTRAHLVGSVSQEALSACYRAADVFVTASEHEGFCVPLLEAMAFEVPVIARAFGAVPGTLGDAGVLLGRDDSPAVAAEAMALLAHDQRVRADLVARGNRRLKEFEPERVRDGLVDHVTSVLE